MPDGWRVGCCGGGDEPDGIAGAEADGVEEACVGVVGAEEMLEGLCDACGDGGGVGGVWIGLGHGGDRSVGLRVYAGRRGLANPLFS